MGKNGVLSTNQTKAMAALLEHGFVYRAAEACGLGSNTIYRYMRDPTFCKELEARQNAILRETQVAIQKLGEKATEVLEDLVDRKGVTDSVKLRAATALLDRAGEATADKSGSGQSDILIAMMAALVDAK